MKIRRFMLTYPQPTYIQVETSTANTDAQVSLWVGHMEGGKSQTTMSNGRQVDLQLSYPRNVYKYCLL